MNFPLIRAFACLGLGVLLSSCGQKGALTLPDTGGATPIVIREGQTSSTTAPATAPSTTPVNPAPPQP